MALDPTAQAAMAGGPTPGPSMGQPNMGAMMPMPAPSVGKHGHAARKKGGRRRGRAHSKRGR